MGLILSDRSSSLICERVLSVYSRQEKHKRYDCVECVQCDIDTSQSHRPVLILDAACRVPRTRIERLTREKVGISGDTAVRLAKFLGTSPEFWLTLQLRFEAEVATRAASEDLAAIKPLERHAA